MTGSGSGSTPATGDLLPHLVAADTKLVRIHQIKDGAIWFGPAPGKRPAYRFDAPNGEYRTFYAAEKLEGAFAETVLRRGRRIISRDFVELRQWTEVRTRRALKLAKLFDNGLVWHGVTADICTGNDYRAAQTFALSLHAAHGDLDGIAYRARHNNGEICYAIFNRIDAASLTVADERHFANERVRTDELMRLHNASWDPMTPFAGP